MTRLIILIILIAIACSASRLPYDVPALDGQCDRINTLRGAGYCQCTARCHDQNYAVRDKGDAVEYFQCMSECACDAARAICVALEHRDPDAAEIACPRFKSVCDNTPRSELFRYNDPRRGNGDVREDSRLSETAIDQLVETGFCAYCRHAQSNSVACMPCLLRVQKTAK
jgi:hypothetical protein